MVAPPPTSVAGPPPHQPAPPHPSPAHPSPTIPTYTPAYNPAPSAPPSHTAYHPPAPSRSSYVPPTGPIDHVIITNATKNCKFAISALQYDDVNTAIDNLEKALALLRPYQK
ncbi:Vta1 like-domain-containing protein [Chytriomyces sp. MP71]|nr:Vta1 like-domain-containing protein [Chytriomyces sp. MP71]